MSPRIMHTNRLHFIIIAALGSCALLGCPYSDQMPPSPLPAPIPPTTRDSSYRITGSLVGVNTSVSGIALELQSDRFTTSAVTGSDGTYTLEGVPPGAYTLTPLKTGLRFTPPFRDVTVVDANLEGQDFHARAPLVTMIRIPKGVFRMGSLNGPAEERPVRQVTLRTFEMAAHEVTQVEWMTVMGDNPSEFLNDEAPVERISWFDAIEFCNRLSVQEGLEPVYTIGAEVVCNFDADGYRLPTEAEWEYSCRAGTTGDRYSGNGFSTGQTCTDEQTMNLIGWYCANSSGRPHQVGRKLPNTLGLYDMLGNVAEWCWDWYEVYSSEPETDPAGPPVGSLRIWRGGSAFSTSLITRSAYRASSVPTTKFNGLGLRLARTVK